MKINCRLCDQPFESLIIDPIIAFKQLSDSMLNHARRKHKERVEEVGKVIQGTVAALMQYISMNEFARIPDGEEWLLKQRDKSLDIVMKSIGFTPEDVELAEKIVETEDKADKINDGENGKKIDQTTEKLAQITSKNPLSTPAD